MTIPSRGGRDARLANDSRRHQGEKRRSIIIMETLKQIRDTLRRIEKLLAQGELEALESAVALDSHVVLGHRPLEVGQGYFATQAQKAVFHVVGEDCPRLAIRSTYHMALKNLTLPHALQLAIAKWEVIEASFATSSPVQIDGGPGTCALCFTVDNCMNCPVAWKAGTTGCHTTPYYDFDQYPTRRNASRELQYLRLVYDDLYFERISRELFDERCMD